MATGDVMGMRDQAAGELAQLQADLESMQAEARGINEANAERAALHVRIQQAKRQIATKADEYGELARMAARIAGGTNYRPLP